VVALIFPSTGDATHDTDNCKSEFCGDAFAPGDTRDFIYAIGDLHGDVDCAQHWVKLTGLVQNTTLEKESWTWSGSSGSEVIFMGDYIDKGPLSLPTVEFVKALTEEFPLNMKALMGNHEMELLKDRDPRRQASGAYFHLPYAIVHPAEFLNFLSDAPTQQDHIAIDALLNASLEVYGNGMYSTVTFTPYGRNSIVNFVDPPDLRPAVAEKLEAYQKSYLDAFRSGTELGSWLEKLPISIMGDEGTIFVHGGVSPFVAAKHLSRGETDVNRLNKQLASNTEEARLLNFLEGTRVGQAITELAFYRGNHEEEGHGGQKEKPGKSDGSRSMSPTCKEVKRIVKMMKGVNRIAVGHTPDSNVRITCDGMLMALDSALGRWFRANGNMYCQGTAERLSRNGKFKCNQIKQGCEGQIVRIAKQDGRVEIIDSSGNIFGTDDPSSSHFAAAFLQEL